LEPNVNRLSQLYSLGRRTPTLLCCVLNVYYSVKLQIVGNPCSYKNEAVLSAVLLLESQMKKILNENNDDKKNNLIKYKNQEYTKKIELWKFYGGIKTCKFVFPRMSYMIGRMDLPSSITSNYIFYLYEIQLANKIKTVPSKLGILFKEDPYYGVQKKYSKISVPAQNKTGEIHISLTSKRELLFNESNKKS